MPKQAAPKTIVIVAFDGFQLLDVTGPVSVFAKVEQLRRGSYIIVVGSPKGGDVESNSGVVLARTLSLADLPQNIDTLLVAGADEAELRAVIYEAGLSKWLKLASSHIRRVGSICTGAFVLAAAGLLDGRRSTTHWRSCDRLQEECRSTKVHADVIYTVDKPIYTSAGVMAGVDLALSLVQEDLGRSIAGEAARDLVVFIRRTGNQPQFSAGLSAQAQASDKLVDLITWIVDHPDADLSVSALAAKVAMSDRNFSRAFTTQSGTTPARFVESSRLERARDLLQNSDWPLERVAQLSGFGSTDALNRIFLKHLKCTPGGYRSEPNLGYS